MRSVVIGMCVMVFFSVSLRAAHTTVIDGNFANPAVWDCSCVPTAADDVIVNNKIVTSATHTVSTIEILSGAEITIGAPFGVNVNVQINSGGLLVNNDVLVVKGDYELNGTHSGAGEIFSNTGGTWQGSGTFSNTKKINWKTGVFTIPAGSVLDFSSAPMQLKSGAKVNNHGDVTVSTIVGGGYEVWSNKAGSVLQVEESLHPGFQLDAAEDENTVMYIKPGASGQSIKGTLATYSNLHIKGTGLSTIKLPVGDLVVMNDLILENATLNLYNGGTLYGLDIKGDWNNVNGRFIRGVAEVTFSGTGQTLNTHLPEEAFHNLVVSGDLMLNNEISVNGELSLSGNLDMNGLDIHMMGDWDCVGTVTGGGGEVIFEGTQDSDITGVTDFEDVRINKDPSNSVNALGTMNMRGSLYLNNGTLNTNDNVVIASNAAGTGRLGEVSFGTLNGDLIVERYMNFASNDWHLIGSSVQGMAINDWIGDFITTGFSGSDWPTFHFNSITTYDETVAGHKDLGITEVSSASDAIASGQGVRAYIASGPNKLSVKGPAHTGAFAWSLDYTNTGSSTDDGWNLISNPYPSTIDWDDASNWAKVGMRDAIYVWGSENGQYASYISGVGTNGGTSHIPSSQAFWIQTNAAGPFLSVLEGAKVTNDQSYRNSTATYFKVRVTTAGGYTDELAVRQDDHATFDYDSDLDAVEFRSPNAGYPSISLNAADGNNLSIYSYASLEGETMIPMPVYVGQSGDVSFEIEGLSGFPLSQVQIFDSMNDTYYRLEDYRPKGLSLAQGDYQDRFFLVLTPATYLQPLRDLEAEVSAYDTWISGESIAITHAVSGAHQFDLAVYNSVGQLVISEKAMRMDGQSLVGLDGHAGLLIVEITDSATGEVYSERVVK